MTSGLRDPEGAKVLEKIRKDNLKRAERAARFDRTGRSNAEVEREYAKAMAEKNKVKIGPTRIQLSRKKGFYLQELSHAINGLPAINCARPGKWGNPFLVHPKQEPGRKWSCGLDVSVPTVEDAVECFRLMMTTSPPNPEPDTRTFALRASIDELRGKNLACWCKIGDPCHTSVLLELANAPACEAV